MSEAPAKVVERYFKAMAAGQPAQEDLLALFAEQAVYTEPFTGAARTHRGLPAIRAAIEASWANTPPDLRLEVQRIDADGDRVQAEWTCSSPVFPAPVRGVDRYRIRAGRIEELVVEIQP